MSGSGLGGVVYPIMFKNLLNQVGFGWSVRALGFLMLIGLTGANLLVRSRIPHKGWSKGRKFFDLTAFREPVFCLTAVLSPFMGY